MYHLLTCACCKLWSRAALGITCPQQSSFAFSLPDLLVEAGCTKCCWSDGFCFIFLCICYTVCPFPAYSCVSDWPLYREIWYLSELGKSVSCVVLSQPAFGEILLLPLVVVTGIFLKTKAVCIFPTRNACEVKVCNGDILLNPVLVVCDMFFPFVGFLLFLTLNPKTAVTGCTSDLSKCF